VFRDLLGPQNCSHVHNVLLDTVEWSSDCGRGRDFRLSSCLDSWQGPPVAVLLVTTSPGRTRDEVDTENGCRHYRPAMSGEKRNRQHACPPVRGGRIGRQLRCDLVTCKCRCRWPKLLRLRKRLQEEGVRMCFARAASSLETLPETRDWIASSPIVNSRRARGLHVGFQNRRQDMEVPIKREVAVQACSLSRLLGGSGSPVFLLNPIAQWEQALQPFQ
jgi:hypothetical protein